MTTGQELGLLLAEVSLVREATFTTSDGSCRPNDESLEQWSVRIASLCHAFDTYMASARSARSPHAQA